MTLSNLKKDLETAADPRRAEVSLRYFKTGKGQYGEGDKFLGVPVPGQRKIAKKYRGLGLSETLELLKSPVHEHRLTALFIMVDQFERGDEEAKKAVYEAYYKHRKYVNNWDLVDSSAPKIVGTYLADKKRDILYKLACSKNIWDRRIAVLSAFTFIRNGDFADALAISEILVNDPHDLIHKAVGWMLREIGKKDTEAEKVFLRKYKDTMPRVMWRYATEKGVKV